MTATQPAQSQVATQAHNGSPDLNDIQAEFQRQRRAIAAIAQQFSQADDLDTLLTAAVEQVRDLIPVSRVLVYHFTSGDRGTVLAEAVERGWTPAQGKDLPATLFGADRQPDYAQRGSVVVEDITDPDLTPYQNQLLNQYQVRSSLSVNLRPSGRVWGLLVVQQCENERQWQPQEIALLEQIAGALALHLIDYDVREQLQQQQAREDAVSKVIDRIRRSLDLKIIFQTTTQEVRQLIGADRVGIFRFNADWSGKFIAESVEEGWTSLLKDPVDPEMVQDNAQDCNLKLMVNGAQTQNYNNAALGEVKDTYLERTKGGNYTQGDKFRIVDDVYQRDFPQCYLDLLERFQARAYLTTAIYQGTKLWGLLACYQCSGPRQWTGSEVRWLGQIADQLGVALQQAASLRQQRLQAQQLQRAVERERAIAFVSDKIKRFQDTNTIFSIATEEVRQLLGNDRVVVYRFNPDWSGEFVAESVGAGWKSLLGAQGEEPEILDGTRQNIDTDGCTIKQMRTRELGAKDTYMQRTQGGSYRQGDKARVCNDIYDSGFPPCYVELLESFQARAYVTVPIFLNDKLWGLMASYQCSGPRQWQEDEVNLAINLGSQLGIALQRAQDLEQVRAQARKLEAAVERERTLALVSDRIKQSQSTDATFRVATGELRRLLEVDRVVVYRFNPDWSGVFVAESVGAGWKSLLGTQAEEPEILDGTRQNIDTEGCTIKQMRTRKLGAQDTYLQRTQGGTYRQGDQYRQCNDVYNAGFPDCYVELLESFQARAYVTVPIFLDDKLWGLLASYQCSGARDWQTEEINLAVNLGGQLGIALQRAQDLDSLKSQKRKLEEAVERERAIALVSDKIRESSDITTIFRIATREVRKVFDSDRVVIYRFNPDWSGEFVAESVGSAWTSLLGRQGEDPKLMEQTRDNIDTEGCTIKQMQMREQGAKDTYLQRTQGGTYRQGDKARVCNDIYESDFPECYIELLEAFESRAYVTVPIFLGDQLWGLLANYQCSEPRQWEDAEIKLMVQLGTQLGIALQRAQDLEQLRAQAQQLSELATREKAARELLQRRALDLLTAVRPALEGDLTVRAPVSDDELGTIADVYNNTLQSLRGIVMQVQSATVKVAETSGSSEVAVNKLAEQAQRQAAELNAALEEVQMMATSTQAVSSNADAIEGAVQNANHTVQSGDAAMNRTVESILAIRDTVAETSQKIRELSESSQKIDRVVKLISDFATQTQLLSLNAAIEATRAGEYGKGFAVVADEVRSLARQSASATLEISNLVAEIRTQTSDAISVTEAAIAQVSAGTNLVEETRESLNAIAVATAQISELVEAIGDATTAQLTQSRSVTETMNEVAAISQSTSEGSVELSSSFQNSLMTAQQLQEVVRQFKVN